MKKMTAPLIFAFLTGCTLTSTQIEHAQDICQQHGGIKVISMQPIPPTAYCNMDGTKVDLGGRSEEQTEAGETSK